MEVLCLLNPGVFRYQGKTFLLVRVAERPLPVEGKVSVPTGVDGRVNVEEFSLDDPQLDLSDPRIIVHGKRSFLSSLSHLRLLGSDDGIHFPAGQARFFFGENEHEAYGIEDCRVATMSDGRFALTYTAVSSAGYGVGLRLTRDWQTFEHLGMIIPPANKDCAIFEEPIGGQYACLHRPSGVIVGGNDIWLGWSPDLRHWGRHVCIARTRPGHWDSARIGAGAAPIKTDAGWLAIYHGADHQHRYCLGALLLDLDNPSRVLARSDAPLMEPETDYERKGFFGEVIFTNGHVLDGDTLTIYYGAADSVICCAQASVRDILRHLRPSG